MFCSFLNLVSEVLLNLDVFHICVKNIFTFSPIINKSFSSVLQAAETNGGDIPIIVAFLDFLKATFWPLISYIKTLSGLNSWLNSVEILLRKYLSIET